MKREPGQLLIRKEGRWVEALLVLMKRMTAHTRWIFAILLLMYLFSGIRTVESNQQVLVLRFGNLQPDVHGPGLLVGLPEPFDRLLRFDTGKETAIPLDEWKRSDVKTGGPTQPMATAPATNPLGIPIPEADPMSAAANPELDLAATGGSLAPEQQSYTLTKDYNLIQGRFVLRYRIANPFHYTVAGEDVPRLLQRLAYQALSSQLAIHPIDTSLTEGRKILADEAMMRVQSEADRLRLGVGISGLDVMELSPPSQVLAAFEDVVNARQFAKTLYESSRQYQTENVTKAQGDASALIQKAQSDVSQTVGAAQGEAASFNAMLVHYRRDPYLVSSRLLNETLETVMKRAQSRTLLPTGEAAPSLMIDPLPGGSGESQ
ncbi:protease modulator HflK [Luteolibacter ambystomatis]|uniref:Protease modulator HflK n=1 Tax=Luteolibacter ambystomatis TaxID=2824561 RepID=A0A975PFZ6_9BACT|nr:protease modulator HflK [Luteolibacter ambystomatis]QUE51897.1 protease modulator HflK [Luteolibacter ambystomatis]